MEVVEHLPVGPDWGRASVAAAASADIITGRADGTFDPHTTITRAEECIILVRALRVAGVEPGPATADFADQASIPDLARDAVREAADVGLVMGYEEGTIRANQMVTRAEAAVMLERFLDRLDIN